MRGVNKVSYAVFLLLVVIFSYFFVDPNLQYFTFLYSGFAFTQRVLTTIFYIIFISLFFVFYLIFLRKVLTNKISLGELKKYIAPTIGILIFAYPAMLSYDVFNYILTSKVLFFYHENPYIIMPIDFIGEPYLAFTHAANKIALYGPAWVLLSSIPYLTGFGNFLATLLSFKVIVAAFYTGTCYVLWKLSKNIFSLALFALNPLVIIETLVSGHNDIVMVFLVLLSYYLLHKKKLKSAIFLFILSILIKYATIILVPLFIYMVCKTSARHKINWEKMYIISAVCMIFIFAISPIREEIYPWYALWFLPFLALVPQKKTLVAVGYTFSLSLLLRYIPFMLFGTYFGPTPILKIILTVTAPFVVLLFFISKKFVWQKIGSF